MMQMSELSAKNFKATIIEMLQWAVTHMLEANEKNRKFQYKKQTNIL